MSSSGYNSLAELTAGSFNWKIKVRIIRNWRGVSSSGDGWKGINLLLLDDKNFRMHAFVPGNILQENKNKLEDGTICIISNFTIKEYETTEKFRCVNHDKQIILTNYTEIERVQHDDGLIQRNMFDFYELSQLEKISDKNVFLTDVVGVIEKDTPIADLTNRFGKKQKQVKFTIVDGRSTVNVCFWDLMAQQFTEAIQDVHEYPTIIIIASAKITSWQPPRQNSKQYEVGNVTATKFYINYEDHSVVALRKMYEKGLFAKYNLVNHVKEKFETLSVADVKKLPIQYAEKEIMCKVKIKSVVDTNNWFAYHCTSCYKEIEMKDRVLKCYRCANRNVPEPDLRWVITVVAEDKTDQIDIVLLDREIRTIFNITVLDFEDEVLKQKKVPPIIKSLENNMFMVKLEIRKANILGELCSYYASGIYSCASTYDAAQEVTMTPSTNIHNTLTQESGPSCHLDDFSDPTGKSAEVEIRPKRKKKPTKKFL